MLTTLIMLKSRLKIEDAYLVDDTLLNSLIKLVSGRFQKDCNRIFDRAEDATEEFAGEATEIRPSRYPIELITSWHLKSSETGGWIAQTGIDFLIRNGCIISLPTPLGTWREQGRVTYDGGYVLPGTTPSAGQTPLPDEVEQACLMQCAHLYQQRNSMGISAASGAGVSLQKDLVSVVNPRSLLPEVQAIIKKYERYLN